MTQEEIRQLCDLAEKRDQKYYAWIRQLLVLASGALTALVAFRADAHSAGIALWLLRVAWVALGLSILLGSLVLHGEVWTAAELANLVAAEIRKQFSDDSGDPPSAIFANRPPRYRRAEKTMYWTLLLAVVALVAHAVLRS